MHLAHRFLIALAPTFMVWAPAPEVQRMKSSMLSKFAHWNEDRKSSCFPYGFTFPKKLVDFSTRLAEMEQNFCTFTARLCKVDTYAASASNVSRSARYQGPSLEQVDGFTAAGSHSPGSSNDNRNTPRRLDTLSSTEDEQSWSANLFRFPCEQYLKGTTKWIDTLLADPGRIQYAGV